MPLFHNFSVKLPDSTTILKVIFIIKDMLCTPLIMTTEKEKLIEEIIELKKQKNAIILAHNYQRPEMYKVADFIGDSLELSKQAAKTDADIILFCGVQFMAETAKILSPKKRVLLPNLEAGCSLADMATVEKLAEVKKQHPNAAVVSYVNTSAEIKAMTDICCTSMNALKIINSIPNKEIIFLPDINLGKYIASKTDKKIILWDGYCSVHDQLTPEMLLEMKNDIKGSKVIAHPECKPEILELADHICGTGGMAKFAKQDDGNDFIIVTECDMVNKLRQDVPEKNFFSFCNICNFMKSTTLELAKESLLEIKHEIEIPEETLKKARKSLDRMLEF